MPKWKHVKHYDVKALDGYVARNRLYEWLEERFCILEEIRNKWLNVRGDSEDEREERKRLKRRYDTNFDFLENVLRFLCDVGFITDKTCKYYVEKMYDFVLEDLEYTRELQKKFKEEKK